MLVTALLASVILSSPSFAQDPGTAKRLIQTAPDTRVWMTDEEITAFSRKQQSEGRLGGYMDVTDHQQRERIALPPLPLLDKTRPSHPRLVSRLASEITPARLTEWVEKFSSFRNRYYQSESGLAAAMWLRDQFQTLARGRLDITVELVQHAFKQPSVIARINASPSSANRNEVVVLGGHLDSISSLFGIPVPSAVAPGADDNASGIATLLEVFRVLVESSFVPSRTIEFIAYAGEERGLLGSQDIAQRYAKERRQVVSVLQLDMTMYQGREPEIGLVSDNTDRRLTQFLAMLVEQYAGVAWRPVSCGYACSDHASWTESGYPAAYPFESASKDYNPDIHTADDTLAGIDASFGMHFAKVALAFAIELGNGN